MCIRDRRKGCVLGADDLAALAAHGLDRVVVARPDPGELTEDQAAAAVAQALAPDPMGQGLRLTTAFAGRVNLNAIGPGLVDLDANAVLALNRVDPAITLATLPPLTRVAAGTLVGTVKIIAYAVAAQAVARASAVGLAALRVRPVVLRSASLILTEVPGQDAKLAAKGRRVIEARLRALGMDLAAVEVVAHDEAALAAALRRGAGVVSGCDMVLILSLIHI